MLRNGFTYVSCAAVDLVLVSNCLLPNIDYLHGWERACACTRLSILLDVTTGCNISYSAADITSERLLQRAEGESKLYIEMIEQDASPTQEG